MSPNDLAGPVDNRSQIRGISAIGLLEHISSMYVCICNAITDKDIQKAVTPSDTATRAGVTALYNRSGCQPECGECLAYAGELMAYYIERDREAQLEGTSD